MRPRRDLIYQTVIMHTNSSACKCSRTNSFGVHTMCFFPHLKIATLKRKNVETADRARRCKTRVHRGRWLTPSGAACPRACVLLFVTLLRLRPSCDCA